MSEHVKKLRESALQLQGVGVYTNFAHCKEAADYIDRLEAEKAELVEACNKAWPMLFRLSYYEGCINQPSLALANELSDILAKHKEKTG